MCSFVPEKRPDWAEAWSKLIRPGGELITLIFPVGLGAPCPLLEFALTLVASLWELHNVLLGRVKLDVDWSWQGWIFQYSTSL